MCVSIGLRKAFECLIIIEIMWSYLIGRLRLALNLAISCGRDFQGLTSTTGKKERERSWEIDFLALLFVHVLRFYCNFITSTAVWFDLYTMGKCMQRNRHTQSCTRTVPKARRIQEIFLIKEQ